MPFIAFINRRSLRLMLTCGALTLTMAGGIAFADRPHVAIVATGGTIAGAQTSPQGPGYTPGVFDVGTVIQSVPQLKDLAEVTGEQLVKIASQDMNDAIWLKLAKRVNELLKSDDVAGVVIPTAPTPWRRPHTSSTWW